MTHVAAHLLSPRDQQIVLERERGDKIVQLGERYGVSHQRISMISSRANALCTAA